MDTDAIFRSVSTYDSLEEGDGVAIDATIAAILARLLASLCNDADREDECRTATEEEGVQLSSTHHLLAELQTANLRLQHQAKQVLAAHARPPQAPKGGLAASGARYSMILGNWAQLQSELAALQQISEQRRCGHEAALQQRQQQAAEARATLHVAIAQAAAVALDSHSGMKLTPNVSKAALEAVQLRAHALEVARLRMLKLQGQLARSMAASTDKGVRCEGLHTVDFERLRMENAALSKEIAEQKAGSALVDKACSDTMQAMVRVRAAVKHATTQQRQAQHKRAELKMRSDACMLDIKQLKQRRDRSQSLLAELRRSDILTEPNLLQEYCVQLSTRVQVLAHIARLKEQHAGAMQGHHTAPENSGSVENVMMHAPTAARGKHAPPAKPLGGSNVLGGSVTQMHLQPECIRLS